MRNNPIINYLFIALIIMVYIVGRVIDIHTIIHQYPLIFHSLQNSGLSFNKFASGFQWLINNLFAVNELKLLNLNGNIIANLGLTSAYCNNALTFLFALWIIYLTFSTKAAIKSTQLLLLAYILFAFMADMIGLRLPIMEGSLSSANVTILAGFFVIAHSCEIMRELTHSTESLAINKFNLCFILLLIAIIFFLAFIAKLPLLAYSSILLFHTYSSFTVHKRKIYIGSSAMYIKFALIFFILIDLSATIFFLNPNNNIGIKLITYLIAFYLYPLAHLCLVLSEYDKQRLWGRSINKI